MISRSSRLDIHGRLRKVCKGLERLSLRCGACADGQRPSSLVDVSCGRNEAAGVVDKAWQGQLKRKTEHQAGSGKFHKQQW